jgi:uncharacterized protein YecE (DUF72 family)
MDFGKLDSIKGIDFSLPPDHRITDDLFARLKNNTEEPLNIHVGCAKWGRKDWIGKLYPKGAKEKDFLEHYVRHFNSIELNALFYNLQPKPIIQRWASLADENFRFCPKFTNTITHLHQLKNADRETDLFIDHMLQFGQGLGYSFLQLSDQFAPNRVEILQNYIQALPRDFRTCVELRHEDWFRESAIASETYELLRELQVGSVITDTSGRRDCLHMKLTAPVAFIRFVGNNLDPSDFTRIASWADRIKTWIDKGLREIYFFIHNH